MHEFHFVTAADFDFRMATLYRKIRSLPKANIKISDRTKTIVTRLKGKEETRNTARTGDYIITGTMGERYVIARNRFPELYELDPENPDCYRSKLSIRAIRLTKPVEIIAPWGKKQRTGRGGYICQVVGHLSDVYLVEKTEFESSYAAVAPQPHSRIPRARARALAARPG